MPMPCLQDLHVALGGVHAVVEGLDGHPANWQTALWKERATIRAGGCPRVEDNCDTASPSMVGWSH